jgi:hypothetical protein
MKIKKPASCEIQSVIKFLNAKNVRPAEIYRQFCEVYGQNAMSDGMVKSWCRIFSEGRKNIHDDDRNGRPSLVTADLLDQVNEKIRESIKFIMSELSHISRTFLFFTARNRHGVLAVSQTVCKMGAKNADR